MLPAGNSPSSQPARGVVDGQRARARAPSACRSRRATRGHAGQQHEHVGADLDREPLRAAVLVDHARDADHLVALRGHGDPAAAAGRSPPSPRSSSATRGAAPSTSSGYGLGTTRRQPRPASGATSQPSALGAAVRLGLGRRTARPAWSARRTRGPRGRPARASAARRSARSGPARRTRSPAGSRSGPGSSRSARPAAAAAASASPSACSAAAARRRAGRCRA